MTFIVPRSVTVVPDGRDARPGADGGGSRTAPLAEFRSERAYVLLGDPGAGKTEAFGAESRAAPGSSLVPARRFISRSLDRHPEWKAETLFIDGLDEVRAGRPDARRPMDLILERLERLGSPNLRLSCRAADWLGRNDLQEIVSTAGYGDVRVLHLEPLRHEDILRILADLGVPDPHGFLGEARERGLEGLLGNPHSLGLLVKAVGGDDDGRPGGRGHRPWPGNRRATFDKACRKLAREPNPEHQASQRSAPLVSLDRIVAAAGHLSALLLLSDKAQVSIDPSEDPDVLCLEDVCGGDQPALLRALKSMLFSAGPDGGFIPPHRQLAEFLGARFLHIRIDSGVPASRVLALMTGEDGVVVTGLRGLSAWLAAFDRPSRLSLVETDPVGVALYGDVGAFRSDEMEALLNAFAEQADAIRPWSWPAVALASLIGQHTARLLAGYLADDDRSEGRQVVAGLLLRGLAHARGARPSRFEGVVRDATWQPWVRQSALRALLHHSVNREDRIPSLVVLLNDIKDEQVEDRDGELRGTLLSALYPDYVRPGEIWDYLLPLRSSIVGVHFLFWSTRLLARTNGSKVISLIHALIAKGKRFHRDFSDYGLADMILALLARALDAADEDTPAATLYDWLELMDFEEFGSARMRRAGYSEVRRWLAERPGLQKQLALEGLGRQLRQDDREVRGDNHYRAWTIRSTVFGEGTPGDFAEWCLRGAVEQASTRLEIALALLEWSRPWHDGDAESGVSIEEVREATRDVPALRREVELILTPPKESKELMRLREKDREYRLERKREKSEFTAHVREHVAELRAGLCAPKLLHFLAQAYNDFLLKRGGATPLLRVQERLGGHAVLAEAAMQGFRRVVERDDLPSLRDIIRLSEQGRMSFFAYPLLAGFDLMGPEHLNSRSSPEIIRVAALYYLIPLNAEGHPEWYRRALQSHPSAVAEALVKVTRSRIRGRRDCLHLWQLPRERSHRAVARLAVPALLRAFPTRCTEPQVEALHHVLLAALRWQPDGWEDSIRDRSARSGMDVSQQVLWLGAGLFVSREEFLPALVEFIEDGEEARVRQLVRLLAPEGMPRLPMDWDNRVLKTLIELLGSRYTPWRPGFSGIASSAEEDRLKVEGLVSRWSNTLATRTNRDASDALQSLVDNPALEPWHLRLGVERDDQVVARRSASFSVPELGAVQRTLANEEPANPADLAALVTDKLELLAAQIRDGNTDDWRQYWSEDSSRQVTGPKHENSCRDALLSDLRQLLPGGVDAQPEGHYARDKRADIRVSFNGSAIPVEIKKDSHRKLWSAVADQLVQKYTIDPESSGFGMYLVLWFGLGKMPVPPTGRRPKTPEALRQRLEEQLQGPYRHKVRVVVIDVSGSSNS